MGITLISPSQYEALQQFTPLDQKTSSWLLTPETIRSLGGAFLAITDTQQRLSITTVRNLTMRPEVSEVGCLYNA